MKADYLRYIYECCHGDNGIYFKDPRPVREFGYKKYMEDRKGEEISTVYIQQDLKEDDVKCELSDVNFYSG